MQFTGQNTYFFKTSRDQVHKIIEIERQKLFIKDYPHC